MTSASADGVPEPAARRLDPAHARAAHRAGALGGGMLWTGVGLLVVAYVATATPLSIALSFAGTPGTTAGSVLAAWLTSPHGALLAAVAILGLALVVAGPFLSVRTLRGAGVVRPRATTLLGATIAFPLGILAAVAAPLATGLMAPRYVAFSTYGVIDAGADTAPMVASTLPSAIAAGAVVAVACTAAGILTWRLAARLLAPRG